jgi:hypothetical protein
MNTIMVWVLFELSTAGSTRPSVRLATLPTLEECTRVQQEIQKTTSKSMQCIQMNEVQK